MTIGTDKVIPKASIVDRQFCYSNVLHKESLLIFPIEAYIPCGSEWLLDIWQSFILIMRKEPFYPNSIAEPIESIVFDDAYSI